MTDMPPKRVKKHINYSDNYVDFLAPRFWPTWLGIGAMKVLGHLPYGLTLLIGRALGNLLYLFGGSRKKITVVNIDLCFPQLNPQQRHSLVKRTMIDNGIGLLEMCIAWFNHSSIRREDIEINGERHLTNALATGHGVILVGAHYTTLDLGGVLMAKCKKVGVMYRANKNPLFDLIMRDSRAQFCEQVIERGDMRAVIRFLKKGGVLWYAPDQDYGRKQSVFAPFFGIEAATINIIPRLVKINQSRVLILGHHRKPAGGYIVSISEPLPDYPSGDDQLDAKTINLALEAEIRKYPEQYMWLHRRFKTRPDGEDGPYS